MKPKTTSARWVVNNDESHVIHVPELVTLGYDRFSEAIPLTDHRHEQAYEFVYMEGGQATWDIGGESITTVAGQMLMTRPDEWHRARIHYIEPCSIWWVIVRDPEQCRQWLLLRHSDKDKVSRAMRALDRVTAVETRVRDNFRQLRDLLEERRDDKYRIRHLLLDIVLGVIYPSVDRSASLLEQSVRTLMEEIAGDPAKRWTVPELAASLNVSESHLFRLFREIAGEAPATFVERTRIEHARRLLMDSDASITSLAMDLGFKTSQHFATVFKRYTGVSPRSWRRQRAQTES
ncbi:AraC family transcriptional regulator [Cohnella sp. GCM10020058]|uniref:helix-turn-helix transcriptional regulator n=1 Tax=Cohnella sp. GCM10020058 TaxID=3317330 RepID=UPI00363E34A1